MELGNNSYENNFTKSVTFKDKINDLDSGINILLDEYKKLYVLVGVNPNNQEYQQQYQNMVNNLDSVMSKLFSVSKDIQVNVNNVNKTLVEYDILIKEEKKINNDVKTTLGIVENENNAASEMISDYKDIYEKRYLRNWSLILGSIIGLIAISRVYKTPVV
jgi:hypothetical protein